MKTIISIIFVVCIVTTVAAEEPDRTSGEKSRSGIEFHDGTWEEALKLANESGKPLFLNISASWCGPCKALKRNTFPYEEVGTYYNAHFINVLVDENGLLFMIERSRDLDEVWYSVNVDRNGRVDKDSPVKVYWVRKSEDSRIEPLTGIQRRFSYGIPSFELQNPYNDEWVFKLAAYKNRFFTLKREDQSGAYKAFTQSAGREVEVVKMYIEFDGGSFLSPSIAYVELHAIDPSTGEMISEIINGTK